MVVQELASFINAYVESGKNQSLHRLGKESNVPYITLRRIIQNEVNSVTLETAISIMQRVAPWTELLSFLEKHYPNTGKWLLDRQKLETKTEAAQPELIDAIGDFEGYMIICLAQAAHTGISEEKITDILGKASKKKVNELLDSGVLIMKDSKIWAVPGTYTHFNLKSAAERVQHCLRMLRDENIGQKKQMVSILTEGVSRDGQIEVHKILEQTQIKIDEVCKNNPGNETIFTNIVMGAIQ